MTWRAISTRPCNLEVKPLSLEGRREARKVNGVRREMREGRRQNTLRAPNPINYNVYRAIDSLKLGSK